MSAPGWALLLAIVYYAAAFGLRTMLHRRRDGDSGFRGLGGRPLSAQWWAGVCFAVAVVASLLGPAAALGGMPSIELMDHAAVRAVGVVLAVLGSATTLSAQSDMGSSWRIGVRDDERTDLVTTGLFGWVRNPVFTAMVTAAAGLFLWVPNAVGLVAVVVLTVAVELQVRVVEEPYLRQVHGAAFDDYAVAVGRFVPGVGRGRRAQEAASGSRLPSAG